MLYDYKNAACQSVYTFQCRDVSIPVVCAYQINLLILFMCFWYQYIDVLVMHFIFFVRIWEIMFYDYKNAACQTDTLFNAGM